MSVVQGAPPNGGKQQYKGSLSGGVLKLTMDGSRAPTGSWSSKKPVVGDESSLTRRAVVSE
jgi:hypothetical protein